MQFFEKIISVLTAFFIFLSSATGNLFCGKSTAYFTADTQSQGKIIGNVVSNLNTWDMGTMFYTPVANEDYNVFEFVEYIQLMQCSGGTAERDLFVDPLDTTVLDDYDFSRLIKNCAGILSLGAKPHLKLGGVPLKYTSGYEFGGFGMNIYPPDDFNVYYNYIYALAEALVLEFGKEEVLSWRFGVMTEYENADWFMAKSKDENDSAVAFCKLYDYTVQALIDAIGEDIFVGAHSMTVTEGLWDEDIFIKHIAQGTNYANGKTGTRVCFLSASFYDSTPEDYTDGYTLPETINYLRKTAENCGLEGLIYGIDEGRILSGITSGKDSDELLSRTCGYTYQAAYDARLWMQCIENDIDYFSSWGYLTDGILNGYPTVSYHVAKQINKFSGMKQIEITDKKVMPAAFGAEVKALAAYDEETDTVRIMAYSFKNDIDYSKDAELKFDVAMPQYNGKEVTVTAYYVNDDCNFFDEWCEDRETYGIGDECFAWSPDDPCLDNTVTLSDPKAREIYENELRDKYIECSQLEPVTTTATVTNGILTIEDTIDGNSVVFYEITVK